MDAVFEQWKTETNQHTKAFDKGIKPKLEINKIGESILKHYDNKALTDKYAMFQHLMDYWAETMQDDFYEIAADGWPAGNDVIRKEKKSKKGGKEVSKPITGLEGLEGRLIPPGLIIREYFADDQKTIDDLEADAESLNAQMEELREEHGGEDGLLASAMDDKGKISKVNLGKAIEEAKEAVKELNSGQEQMKLVAEPAFVYGDESETTFESEPDMLEQYKDIMDKEVETRKKIKVALEELEQKVIAQYSKLSIDEMKTIVVDKKWMAEMERRIRGEMDNISHRLTRRIKELAERYETPLPMLNNDVRNFTAKVKEHLRTMGYEL